MSDPVRVGVSGFLGRMGANVVEAVQGASDMLYVGGADPSAQASVSENRYDRIEDLLENARPDVVVDFSVPASVYDNAMKTLRAGAHCVVGTTGLSEEQRQYLDDAARARSVGILVAPNFAVGAVLMMEFARKASAFFEGVEIIELHHDKKVDAPSGTALMTAGKIGENWQPAAQSDTSRAPARGQAVSGVAVHSVRLPGLVAHQEVLFGNPGEALTIRHDSFDRKSFMPGVLLGVRRIREHQGLVYGLENFLFG
ncbi:MAG: 4-hydroxy-tetrahydrodipicolinate reductase [Armatimonadetes bacterium]|nr:4-hydroxy-tetrahydrodipicolinate reductase [Armatimonadota bacterium]